MLLKKKLNLFSALAVLILNQLNTCHSTTVQMDATFTTVPTHSETTAVSVSALPAHVLAILDALKMTCDLYRPYLDNSTEDFVKAIQIVHQQLFEKHLNPKYACYITAACEIHRGNDSNYCPVTIDLLGTCFPETEKGDVALAACPVNLNGVSYENNVSRKCYESTEWAPKSNYNDCRAIIDPNMALDCISSIYGRRISNIKNKENNCDAHYEHLVIISIVARAISLFALLLTFAAYWICKRVRCPKHVLHWNLVATLILRNTFWFAVYSKTTYVAQSENWIGCRVLVFVFNYAQVASYCWMFVSGVYVTMLIAVPMKPTKCKFRSYVILGWGGPVPILVTWLAMKLAYEDHHCWFPAVSRGSNDGFADYFYQVPIVILLVLNFFILLNIVRTVVLKVQARPNSQRRSDYWKAARAFIFLFPVLGINYILFFTSPTSDSTEEIVFVYINTFLQSFQGLVVCLIFFCTSKDIRKTLKKKFFRWKTHYTIPYITNRSQKRRFSSVSASRSMFNTQAFRFSTKSNDVSPRRSKASISHAESAPGQLSALRDRHSAEGILLGESHSEAPYEERSQNLGVKSEINGSLSTPAALDSPSDEVLATEYDKMESDENVV